jgi:WD40 repeat protein
LVLANAEQIRVYLAIDRELAFENHLIFENDEKLTAMCFANFLSPKLLLGALDGPSGHVIRCWDLDSKIAPVRDLQGPRATVTALRASPFRLYAVDSGGTCYLWEKVDQEYDSNPTVTVPLHAGPMLGLEVDGSFLFAVSADQIQVLDGRKLDGVQDIKRDMLAEEKPLARLTAAVRPVSRWTANQGPARGGRSLGGVLFIAAVSLENTGVILEWSLSLKKVKHTVIAHDVPVTALLFGPYDNGPLISADANGGIRIWDLCSMKLLVNVRTTAGVKCLAVEPQRRFFTTDEDGYLKTWTLMDDEQPRFPN